MAQASVEIQIRGTADSREVARFSKALEDTTKEARRAEVALEGVGDEYAELARETRIYEKQLESIRRAQTETGRASEYSSRSILQAYRREQYELGKRAEFDEDVWQRRRAQLAEERELKRNQYREDSRARRDEWQAAQRREELWRHAETAILAAGAAMAYYAAESYKAAGVQDSLMRQVAQISDVGVAGLGDMKGEALALSSELKILPNVMAQTLYQAKSLGSDDAFGDAELAAKAAVAGYTEANLTLEAGLKVLNAYPDAMYELERVYDLMFKGVELGAFTMEDLANGMSDVTSVAGETSTSLEDVLSMLIVMTRQGDSFNEAVELSGLLLQQLATEGTAAATAFSDSAGQSYRDFIAQGGSLVEALALMEEHAESTGKTLGEMIGGSSPFYRDTQAARAAMELTGFRLEELRDVSLEVSDASGTMMKNYEIMAEGIEQDTKGLAVAWESLKIATGEWVASLEVVPSVLANITAVMNLASGASGAGVAAQLRENAEAMGDLKAEAQALLGLTPEFNASVPAWASPGRYVVEWVGYQAAVNEAAGATSERLQEINTALAQDADSVEAWREAMQGVYGDAIQFTEDSAVIAGDGFKVYLDELDTLWGEAQAGIKGAAVELESFDKTLRASDRRKVTLFSFAEREARESGEAIAGATRNAIEYANILKTLDGDTVDIEGTGKVRLRGVDTPETAKAWLNQAGMPFGEEALRFTQQFLLDPQITVSASGTDPYDRAIASLINGDGASLEEELIKEGLALPLPVELTGDEAYSNKLEMLARRAADQQKGIFADERVADAFLEGRIGSMEQLVEMYDTLQAADAEYYSAYVGYLKESISTIEEMQAALQALAVDKALAEAGFEKAPQILDMAVAMGVMTKEEAALKQQFADSALLIDEYAVEMGEAEQVTADMSETMQLLATGLFDSTEDAGALAAVLDAETVAAFVAASGEGQTLADTAASIGVELSNIPRNVRVKFESDTSNWNPPTAGAIIPPEAGTETGTTTSGHVYGADGGLVTGGIQGRDSVPAMLMPGEYVLRADAVRRMGVDRLHQLNAGVQMGGVNITNTFNGVGDGTAKAIQSSVEASSDQLRHALAGIGLTI